MLSEKCNWNLKKNELFSILEDKKNKNQIIIDLIVSNPTECNFKYKKRLIKKSLTSNKIFKYNPDPHGLINARESISYYYYENYKTNIDCNKIFITTSTSESYSFIFKLICNYRENILIPRPGYPLFEYLAKLEGIDIRNYNLEYTDKGWIIDFDTVKKNIDNKTKAIIIINPNNPTGSYIKAKELEILEKICLENNLFIISDEVFSDYIINYNTNIVQSLIKKNNINSFILNGFSKMLGLPQVKLGWFIVNSNSDKTLKEIISKMEIISDTYLSTSIPIQIAVPTLLKTRNHFQKQIINRIKNNLKYITNIFNENTPFRIFNIEGGWSCIIEGPKIDNDDNIAKNLLLKYNTLIYPGYFFDFEKDCIFVFSLLTPEKILKQGLLNFKKYYEELL